MENKTKRKRLSFFMHNLRDGNRMNEDGSLVFCLKHDNQYFNKYSFICFSMEAKKVQMYFVLISASKEASS